MKLITLRDVYDGNKPNVVYWTRDEKGIRKQHIINDFEPYFYVLEDEYPYKDKSYSVVNSLKGQRVVQYKVDSPNDVPNRIGMFSKTWEDDIKYRTRYLLDKIDKIDYTRLRKQYIDIEMCIATEEITSLAVYDNFLKKCICFVWRKDLKYGKLDRHYKTERGFEFDATIYKYRSERELLETFIKFIQDTDPDILTGWYFIDFDMTWIINRINSFQGLSSNSLSPIGRCYVSENSRGEPIKCFGRIIIDMLRAYSELQQGELSDESLEAISQDVLGEGKVEHDENLDDLWQQDIERFVEYNCIDTMLVYRIDEKAQVISYYDTMRRFCGSDWENMYSNTQLWDIYMLRKVKGRCVLPSKRTQQIPRIPGAEVFEPTKGIHDWVCLLDLKSLYPSIIITFNMSPETILDEDNGNCHKLTNGIMFDKTKQGLLPEMLLELFDLRKKYKDVMETFPYNSTNYKIYNNLQYAVKQHMNALYGAMLFKNFRLSKREIGESITYCGRSIITWIREEVQRLGFRVLYGDTDSVFIFSKEKSIEKIVEEFTKIVDHLNRELPNKVAELGGNPDYCEISIQPEKIYKKILMTLKKDKSGEAAKKMYAGRIVWANGKKDDKVEIKGFSIKKSNSSLLTKELGDKIFKCIFGYEDLDNIKIYIREVKDIIENNSPDWYKIGVPQGIRNLDSYKTDSPWIRGCRYSNEYLGETFGAGDKPRIVYVLDTPSGYPRTDVVAFRRKLPEGFKINTKKMFEKVVVMKFEHIFSAADLSFEKYAYGQESLMKW